MKKILLILLFISGFMFAMISSVRAQITFTQVASGLIRPIGISMGPSGYLLVAEAGTGNNDGRIDLVNPGNVTFIMVDSLPSFLDTVTQEVAGPWRAYYSANGILNVIVGGGPDINAGSILTFDVSTFIPGMPPLRVTDAIDVFHEQAWALSNGFAESDIFSAVWDSSGNVYMVDAAANALFKKDMNNVVTVLDTFPDIVNFITPFPPTIDYVPTMIIHDGDSAFYVCNLTGFPFFGGLSSILHVDTAGNTTTYTSGLTQLVDMFADSVTGDLYALQFGRYDTNFVPMPGSAMINHIAYGGGFIDTLVSGFGPSAGFMRDSTGDIYVTNILSGTVTRISFATGLSSIPRQTISLSAFPVPATNELNIHFSLEGNLPVTYEINDMTGKLIYSFEAGTLNKGEHTLRWNGMQSTGKKVAGGAYLLTLFAGENSYHLKVMLE